MEPSNQSTVTFTDLPFELREMIWVLAIWNCEYLHEAHFFDVGTDAVEHLYETSGSPLTSRWRRCAMSHLRPPECDTRESALARWASKANKSGYMGSSGLWNACTESRNTLGTLQNVKFTESGKDWFVTANPRCDLCCVPSMRLGLMGREIYQLGGRIFKQIAIEFDPRLVKEMEHITQRMAEGVSVNEAARCSTTWTSDREVMRTLRLMLEHVGRWGPEAVLWLIDCRMRPSRQCIADGVPDGARNRQVFRARDRRFVEVRSGDIRWQLDDGPLDGVEGWWDLRGVDVDYSQEIVGLRVICKDVFVFSSGLQRCLSEICLPEGRDSDDKRVCSPRVGVLACVMEDA